MATLPGAARAATVSSAGTLTIDFTSTGSTTEEVSLTRAGIYYMIWGNVTCGAGTAPEPGYCLVPIADVTASIEATVSGDSTDQTLNLIGGDSTAFPTPHLMVNAGLEEVRLSGAFDVAGATAYFTISSPVTLVASTNITADDTIPDGQPDAGEAKASVRFADSLDADPSAASPPNLTVVASELFLQADVGVTEPIGDLSWSTPDGAWRRRMTLGYDPSPLATTIHLLGDASLAPTVDSEIRFQQDLTIRANSMDVNKLRWREANPASLTIDVAAASRIRGSIDNFQDPTNRTRLQIVKSNGAGSLTLEGSNTTTDPISVNAGTLIAAHANALGTTAANTTVGTDATLALSGGITIAERVSLSDVATLSSASGANTVTGTVTLAGSSFLDAAAGSSLAVAAVGGGANVIKSGDGTVRLTAANTYLGTTAILDGVLDVAHANGLASTSGVTVADGGTLQLSANTTYLIGGANNVPILISGAGTASGVGALHSSTGTATLTGGDTLSFDADATLSAANGAALSINLTTVSAAGHTIRTANTGTVVFTTAVSAGAVDAAGPFEAGNVTTTGSQTYASTLTINSLPSTLTASQLTATTIGAGFAPGDLTLDLSGTSVVSGAISNGLASYLNLVKTGAGTLTLGGTNTYSGTTTVTGGTLAVTNGRALGWNSGGSQPYSTTTVQAGAAVAISGGITLEEPLTLAGGGVGGTGALRSISGNNALNDQITLGTGATIGVDADKLRLTELYAANALTDGTGSSFTKVGDGRLELTYASDYSGGTTIADGVLAFDGFRARAGTGAVQVLDGAAVILDDCCGGTFNVTNAFSLAGSGPAGAGALVAEDENAGAQGTPQISGTITLAADATIGSLGNDILEVGAITGATHELTVPDGARVSFLSPPSGLGTLRLDGRGFSGVDLGASTIALGSNAELFVEEDGDGVTLTADTFTAAAGSTIEPADGTPLSLTLDIATTGTIAGTIADGLSVLALTKDGGGSVTLSGANSYTRATSVDAGTLVVANPLALGNAGGGGTTTVADGATVAIQGGISTSESFQVIGSGVNGGGALRSVSGANTLGGGITMTGHSDVGVDAGTLTIADAVSGNYALTKVGNGRLALAQANTYTGDTILNAGSLAVSGAVGSVATTNGTTLTGSGTIAGANVEGVIDLDDGGAPSRLTSGAMTLNPGGATTAQLAVAIDGTATAGSDYSQLDVNGAVTLGGAALDVSVGYTPSALDTVTIIDNDGADAVTGTFAGLAEGALLLIDGVGWRVSYTGGDGNDVTLSARLTPGAPTGLSVTAGNGSAAVSWQAPSATGGESIASYTVTGSPGGSCTTTATSCTITGLANGTTYTFTVTATNAVGTSTASARAAVAPRTVPSAPTGVEAVAGALRATVSWVASTDDGGRPITAYTVTAQPDGATCTTTATTCTITRLRNTKAYTFTVTATNEAGTSGASSASTTVRPYRKLKMKRPRARGVRLTSRVRVTGAATITQIATTSADKTACRKRIRAKRKRTYTVACTLNRATRNALKKRTQTFTVTTTVRTKKGATFQATHTVRAKKTRRR